MHSNREERRTGGRRELAPEQLSANLPASGIGGVGASGLRAAVLPRIVEAESEASPVELPPAPTPRSFRYLIRQALRSDYERATGLEHLTTRELLAVKDATGAFDHAVHTELRAGWWSSLFASKLLDSAAGRPLREYLEKSFKGERVVEIGPGERMRDHPRRAKQLGARAYIGIDLQEEAHRYGAIKSDILPFLTKLPDASIGAVMAFGVFNEPMSLQFPGDRPPRFLLPARHPAKANRAHAEHEYVRRLAREIHRVLIPGGVLFGDGLHSRGFERDVESYLTLAGFVSDDDGHRTLQAVDESQFGIRNPFFLRKSGGER